ncbi:MAG TPA: BadF/BadG/BcrA/BcrD ATPase family protein [Solirubrobacteraceae bacterium]|nr:BadF/BadG/BcrA/BcrD ATPase family protein [Solirubrobacteraceae bacterium]
MTPAALAVDAGQTLIRAAHGPRTAAAPGVLRIGGRVGPDEVAAGLLAAVAELGPLPSPAPPAGIGLSGFEAASERDLDRVADRLRRELGLASLAIASDALTALLGAIGSCDGVVVAAGTGTACLARHGARFAKVDGWGSLLGDAGSGFAIGRAGLDAALREFDGRGGSRALMGAAERAFGAIESLPEQVYAAPSPSRAVAAFAVEVARAATDGDERSRAILEDAGRELAISACAALSRLFAPDEPALVSYTGNVFRAGPPILEPFTRAVAELRPTARLAPPAGDPLEGARLLVELRAQLTPEPGLLQLWP